MKGHYSPEAWRAYRLNAISEKHRRGMERHLGRCEACLQTYLQAVDEQVEAAAALLLPPDFTSRVAARAHSTHRHPGLRRRRSLLQYAAAASITLALTAGGFFEVLIRDLPPAIEEIKVMSRAINRAAEVKWSDELAETASAGIHRVLFEKGE